MGALDLTALGIGAIIGTGIFVIIGEAIAESGPAIVISFVLAGVTCIFSALYGYRNSRLRRDGGDGRGGGSGRFDRPSPTRPGVPQAR